MSLTTTPFPPFIGGEDTASQVGAMPPGLARRVENGRFTGAGRIQQIEDWRLADTCKNATPLENHAVCGIFPFATQGGAASASAGIAFSFNTTDNKIYLHQIGEDNTILRTLEAYTAYAEAAPPQITGFEMFGKFYYAEDGREATASRKGMAVFDPTGAGAVTHPTFDLVGGGVAAAVLRFKGIAVHRGGSIIGWGYGDEEVGNVDLPHILRYSKYTAPDTWVPDTTETSAGKLVVGKLNTPIVACATSGQYTILGKQDEVFAFFGDFGAALGYTQIGFGHGPVSVTGMVSNGPAAWWMSSEGPAYSLNGGDVTLLKLDSLTKRFLTYYDLTYAWAAHDTPRTRVGWLLRRRSTLTGAPLTANWADQILWYDYERDDITVQGLPTTCFSIGTVKGPGITLAGPSGTPTPTGSTVTSTSAILAWTHGTGDLSASISIEYKLASLGTYTVLGPANPGTLNWTLTSLTASTAYNWRLRYFKNGQYSAYTAVQNFTTSAASACAQPTSFAYTGGGSSVVSGRTYWTMNSTWVQQEFASGALTDVFEGTSATFSAALSVQTTPAYKVAFSVLKVESATPMYYWVRHRLSDGTVGTETLLTGAPVQFNSTYMAL